MKTLKTFGEYNEEVDFSIRKKVDIPEKDILETIDAIKNWLDKNPNKNSLTAGIFGHQAWKINRKSIEKDIREAASKAYPYKKQNEDLDFDDMEWEDTGDVRNDRHGAFRPSQLLGMTEQEAKKEIPKDWIIRVNKRDNQCYYGTMAHLLA